MTVASQIISGVAVLFIMGVGTIFITDHMETKANTVHRLESKETEILNMLIEIKTNQEHLLKKYDRDISGK